MPSPSSFKTHRLPIAAFLMARGQALEKFSRENGTVYFYFADSEACFALQSQFLSENPPEKVFWNKTNDLKDIIFAGQAS